MRTTDVARLLMVFTASLFCGCGSVKTGTVSGKVSYQGKPFPGGTITFQTPVKIGESLTPFSFQIADDGSYTATNLPYGEYQVGIAPKSTLNSESAKVEKQALGDRQAAGGAPTPPPAPPPPKPGILPASFNDPMTSGVSFTVDAPMATHDFDLK